MELERRGIPAVVIAHDRFEKAARQQALNLGMPNLNIVVIEQARAWHTDEHRQTEIARVLPQVVAGLVKPQRVPQS